MMGWPQNEAQGALWNIPVEQAAKPLIALMERYRPQVVVTYDANGFYGHPDHIQAHRITMQASRLSNIPDKVYATALPKSLLSSFAEIFVTAGLDPPEEVEQENFGTNDECISASIDCTAFIGNKFEALAAHRSQTDNDFFLALTQKDFAKVFAHEYYVRLFDRTDSPVPETDLFAGITEPTRKATR
jgi:LmbE family N-acetylglucosaminyl deacetylase